MDADAELEALRARRMADLERQAVMPVGVVDATDADLDDVLQNSDLVFVDFWAPWCGPCQAFAPVFEAASKVHAGKAVFVKVNVDENQRAAMTHQVQSIPTLMVFKDGRPVHRQAGAMPAPMFDAFVRQFTA